METTQHHIGGKGVSLIIRCLFSLLATGGTVGAQEHPDSLAVDSAVARARAMSAMAVPMALPAPPNITYTVPSQLAVGTAVSYAPTNTGGAVFADWDVTTHAGSVQGYADGTGTSAQFHYPSGIVSDGSGNLYVSEARNHRIRKITPTGVVTTFAGSGVAGTANGTGTAAQFNYPVGLALDGSGNLYVVDRSNHKIRKITPAGVVTTFAGSGIAGSANGPATSAQFKSPSDVAVDASGNVYVTDEQNQRIRKITPGGVVTTLAGSGLQESVDGTGTSASFNIPQGLTIDGSGNLYVGDQVGNRIRKVTPAGVVTTFSTGVTRPISLEIDASGNLYAGELNTHVIKRITPAGAVATIAGTGSAGSDNGPPLSAGFNFIGGIAHDPQGNRYVADMWNNRVRRMGTGQGYTVSPALPTGLSLNRTTGVISGTPTANAGTVTYTIKAHNAGGTGTYAITFSVGSGASGSDQNYIRKTTYLGRYTTPQANPPVDSAMRDITYYDGLGRPVQEIGIRAAPSASKDVVTPITYDGFGRRDRDYLPYATATGAGGAYKATALTSQPYYYNNAPSGVVKIPASGGVTPSYGRRVYEASPLDRVLEQGFPGAAWQPAASRTGATGHTVVTDYGTNNAVALDDPGTRKVMLYGVALSAEGIPALTLSGNYAAGTLYLTVTKDEDWVSGRLHTVEEYTDRQGRVVCRRTFTNNTDATGLVSTYYVYNDLGQLSYVLTPGAVPDRGSLPAAGAARNEWLDNFAYRYRYDGRGRMVEKKVPGRGAENYVYNRAGWLVYHQDARQASETVAGFTPGQYHTFHKYDGQGRLVIRGVERNRSWTREQIQAHVNGQTSFWEERSKASGNMHGYTNASQPQGAAPGDMDILEVNYYDRYDTIPGLPVGPLATHSKLVQGKLVASKAKVIGTADTYLWTVYFYDDRGNVVREWRQHYKGGATGKYHYDAFAREYTFTGRVKKETRGHYLPNAGNTAAVRQLAVVTEYEYDHRERLTHTWKTVHHGTGNTGTRTLLAKQAYNEVGQLRARQLSGNSAGTSFGQSVFYTYNERGWVLKDSSGLFSQELRYNTGTTKYYNGNIAQQLFTRKHGTGTVSGTYSYAYDGLGRLTAGSMAGGRGREGIAYDRMGNITVLNRRAGDGTTVDSLVYAYSGNRLASVNDRSGNTSTSYMLRGQTNYTYDANGNVKTRVNGTSSGDNITGITYNYLDLPQSVTAVAGNVTYTYDATGRKLRSVNGIGGQTRDYVEGIEYYNGAIELIHTEEGRILKSGGTYTYEYFLKDHLGNVRSAFAGGAPTVPVFGMDYYPFGLQHNANQLPGNPKNNYLYNGKELQDRVKWYDYGARFYDPVIARWGSVDPLAEQGRRWSPYAYAFDPIIYVDPDGRWSWLGAKIRQLDAWLAGQDPSRLYKSGSEWGFNTLGENEEVVGHFKGGPSIGKQILDGAMESIPVVSYGLSSGDKLESGDYLGATADFGNGLTEALTLGYGTRITTAVVGFAERLFARKAGQEIIEGSTQLALETTRMRLLRTADNSRLKEIIGYLYREEARYGSGSTGSMIREELMNGTVTSASGTHAVKAQEGLNSMRKFLQGNYGNLSDSDRKIVFEIIEDLTTGTGLKWQP